MYLKYITERRWAVFPGRRQPPLRGWLVYEGLLGWLKREYNIDYKNLFLFFSNREDNKITADSFIDIEKKEKITMRISEDLKDERRFDQLIEQFEKDTIYLDEFSRSIRISPCPEDIKNIEKAFDSFCRAWKRFAPALLYIIFIEESLERSYEESKDKKYSLMLEKLSDFRDRRKKIYDRCWYEDSQEFLRYVAKSTGLGRDIEWVSPETIIRCLNKKTKQYFNDSALIYYDETAGGLHIEYGENTDQIKSEITDIHSAQQVEGKTACKGYSVGIVRIITQSKTPNNLNSGDIIVSKMTTPDLVTIMRQAAAIVTDEGGITSHASVISREFGIPCIVGTGNATRIFRDGDRIEVDANRGTARKLE